MHRVLLLIALPLLAQDNPPRSKAADYIAHVALPGMEIGAEYLLHSIPTEKGFYFTKDYLVVDVGVFPAASENVKISSGQFTLRVNHGPVLTSDSPGTVAASVKYPDWERPGMTAQAGPITIGAPTVGRFPGDRRESQPLPPPVKEEPDPSGAERQPPKTIDEMIALAALSEGHPHNAVKGCLFFPILSARYQGFDEIGSYPANHASILCPSADGPVFCPGGIPNAVFDVLGMIQVAESGLNEEIH